MVFDYIFVALKSIGVIGNLLICFFFIKINWGKLKTMSCYHFLLILLAIVDLENCVLVLLLDFSFTSMERYVFIIIENVNFVFQCHSIYVLLLVSVSRYRTICYPFKTRWNKRKYFSMFLLTLLVSFLHALDFLYYGIHTVDQLVLILTPCVKIFPCSMLCFHYYKISKTLKESEESQAKKRNEKAKKTLKYLVIIYVVSTIPVEIFLICQVLLKTYEVVYDQSTLDHVALATLNITYFNNICNVFIYMYMMPEFRRFIFNLICFRCRNA